MILSGPDNNEVFHTCTSAAQTSHFMGHVKPPRSLPLKRKPWNGHDWLSEKRACMKTRTLAAVKTEPLGGLRLELRFLPKRYKRSIKSRLIKYAIFCLVGAHNYHRDLDFVVLTDVHGICTRSRGLQFGYVKERLRSAKTGFVHQSVQTFGE